MSNLYWRLPTVLYVMTVVVTVIPAFADEMNPGVIKMTDMLIQQAEKGNPIAQYNLGTLYYLGLSIDQNYQKAHRWLDKSAAQNNPLAQGLLGIMYFKGQGVAQDYQQAYTLLQQSAEQGYAVAQTLLAGMYYTGQGVPKNYQEACKWAILAAGSHEKNAEALLTKLRQEMTSKQIDAAQKEAHEWRVRHLMP